MFDKVLVGVFTTSIDDTRVKYVRLRLSFQEPCTRLLDERSHHTRRCVTVTELLAMTK
jgi:hypothetical protein